MACRYSPNNTSPACAVRVSDVDSNLNGRTVCDNMPENLLGDENSALNNASLLIQRGFFLGNKSSHGFWGQGSHCPESQG
ncbi:protein of unknown function (plasmid) [Candidatus Methylocalor cossyra]|uniref:Uncharacterized protein n=1 Tax=Candidatus Methylocalor cossyra TaxID=3108543 RepID=A0ABM9NN04_9GAMM